MLSAISLFKRLCQYCISFEDNIGNNCDTYSNYIKTTAITAAAATAVAAATVASVATKLRLPLSC